MDLSVIVSYLPRELGARIEYNEIVMNVKGKLISKLKLKRRYRTYSIELRIGLKANRLFSQYSMLDIFAKGRHPHISSLNKLCIDWLYIPMFLRDEKEVAETIIKIIALLPHYNPRDAYVSAERRF